MLEKTLKLSRLSELYSGLLTDKQKEAFDLYYNCDMSLSELAAELKISRQGVRDTIARAGKTLADAEDKIGYCARLEALSARLKALSAEPSGVIKDALLDIANELEE